MAKGRKRKTNVGRHPSGQIRRDQYEEPAAVATLRRLRDELEHQVTHPWYGFPLGKMALEKYISGDELDAGRAWAELTWRWSQINGHMLPKCKAVDWEGQQGRSLAQEPSQETIEAVRARKEAADSIINSVGLHAMRECQRVIICDEPPSDRYLLKKVLEALVASSSAHKG